MVFGPLKHTYFFDPREGKWDRSAKPNPYRGNFYTVTLISTPKGLVAWTPGERGKILWRMNPAEKAWQPLTIQGSYPNLEQIRIYVLTDRQSKAKTFKSREISGKTIKLEVMDIERLHRHLSEGKPRDELVVNFEEVSGGALPCVYVPDEKGEYDYALTVIPGAIFSGSNDGALRAYSATDGAVLWEFDSNREFVTVNGVKARGASMIGPGPAISGGMIFVNSGYGAFGGRTGNVLLAFGVN